MSNPVSLINTARRGNRLINKTITCVNPDATDAELGEFLGAYNDLSEDKFVSATRVARSGIDVPAAQKPSPNLTVTIQEATLPIDPKPDETTFAVSRLGNGAVTVTFTGNILNELITPDGEAPAFDESTGTITFFAEDDDTLEDGEVYSCYMHVTVAETADYAAQTVDITLYENVTLED